MIELLSEGTAAIASVQKLDEYLTIDTLEEYVLVDSRTSLVRVYRRAGEVFGTYPAMRSGTLELGSLGISLALADLYEDVEF